MNRVTSLISRALPTDRFARGVSVLVGGTVGGQAITIAAAPVLTRLYSPQDFGLLAVFAALLSTIAVVASLRYELAIPLPDDDKEGAALLLLCLAAVVAAAALCAVPIVAYRQAIARLLQAPRLADYVWLVPLGILLAGVYNVMNFWAVRMKAFAPLAKTKVGQSLAAAAIQLGGAPFGPAALLLGHVAGQASGSLSIFLRVLRPRWDAAAGVRLPDVARVIHRYRRFPLFSTWGALFNAAAVQSPPVLLALLFSPATAGMYALANRILSMPMQLLGQAIGNVFFSGAAQAYREGRLGGLVAKVHGRLAHIGMPPMLVLVVAGPDIFGLAFGAAWREAGVFAQWLAPSLYLVFITSPLTSLFDVINKLAAAMAFQGALLAVNVAAIVAGAWSGDARFAIALLALGNAVCRLAGLIWLIRASGNGWGDVWRPSFGAFAWAAALASPLLAATLGGGGKAFWVPAFATALLFIAGRYAYLMKKAWS